VRGDYASTADKGEVSQFGALTAALAGTLGVGNVASVALAISIGGPGAVFWLTATGFFGMSLKFCECALAVKYRRIGVDGVVNGGPMHYLPLAFAKIGLRPLGLGAAVFFSVATLLASTSLFQVNQAFVEVRAVTGLQSPLLFGLLFALLVGAVIVGGMKGIARVCTRLVPAMVLVYFIATGTVLVAKAAALPAVFAAICTARSVQRPSAVACSGPSWSGSSGPYSRASLGWGPRPSPMPRPRRTSLSLKGWSLCSSLF
jgi:AGCS family alanine or glycine:cation symporter